MKEVKPIIYFESLGCDKNLVDSEVMLGMLSRDGYRITMDPEEADVVVVNTCSFIHDAKEESVNAILGLADLKNHGKLQGLVVVGCLSQLYQEEIQKEIPEVDAILGAANYDRIIEAVEASLADGETGRTKYMELDTIDHQPDVYIERMTETTKHYAYLKIAEGCDNYCTYCIIPKLRGRFRSRETENLLDEVRYLVSMGKSEIILVAQDVGKYGLDIYGERRLTQLIDEISEVEGVEWIRLLYVYPEDVTDELIDTIAANPKVLHYIDMPLQHIDDMILKKMARKSRRESIVQKINTLRERVPDMCIRTTFIVGFPGETEDAFNGLQGFVEEMRLDRVGVFTYSREEGTPAYDMPNQVDHEIAKKRQEILMMTQQEISTEKNQDMIGRELTVVVDGYVPKDEIYIARSYKDNPDVDGYVFVESENELMSGDYVKVRIIGANEYDLIGEII